MYIIAKYSNYVFDFRYICISVIDLIGRERRELGKVFIYQINIIICLFFLYFQFNVKGIIIPPSSKRPPSLSFPTPLSHSL